MREMSATEVARRFSAVLDGAERGDTVAVVRGGRQVAVISPAPPANGALVRDIARDLEAGLFDAAFAEAVAQAGADADLDTDPWQH